HRLYKLVNVLHIGINDASAPSVTTECETGPLFVQSRSFVAVAVAAVTVIAASAATSAATA
ncbi:hypothetical protein, partial [Micromonospora sp. NPDC050200]|uniref:hypothetical protein n=1 Tax=Micromonospora sp. NPDC050200 TaxID=3155664 RepID=UPI0033D60D3B